MSRKRSYRSRAEKKKSRLYLILALLISLLLLKWGVPLAVEIITRTGHYSSGEDSNNDILPPQPPVLAALPEATNSGKLKIEGYTEAGAELSVWLNDGLETTDEADDEGNFIIWIDLEEGDNEIAIKAKDEAGNESYSSSETVVWDKEPLEMEVDNPQDGTEYFGQQSQTIEVSGLVNKAEARVTINGLYTSVDSEGKFSHSLRLNEGENKIEVKAIDPAGNEGVINLTVQYVK